MKTALYVALGLMATAYAADAKKDKPAKPVMTCDSSDSLFMIMKAYDDNKCTKVNTKVKDVADADIKLLLNTKETCHQYKYIDKKGKSHDESYKSECETEDKEVTDPNSKDKKKVKPFKKIYVKFYTDKKCAKKDVDKFKSSAPEYRKSYYDAK